MRLQLLKIALTPRHNNKQRRPEINIDFTVFVQSES